MAQITFNIPNDKVQLVLDAFAEMKGIDATSQAFKAEIINEVKQTVKQYKARRLIIGLETSVSQADMEVNVT